MARLVYGMNLSLDGYVDHDRFAPDPVLFRHWVRQVEGLTGSLYGRRLYEIMRYWDGDDPAWSEPEGDFAAAWRRQHKWVVSRSLASVGPNATLIGGDVDKAVRALKSGQDGEIDVGGPNLAGQLGALGLIDEYRLYFSPFVLGQGTPFFSAARAPLRLIDCARIGADVICLTYRPA